MKLTVNNNGLVLRRDKVIEIQHRSNFRMIDTEINCFSD